MFAGAAPVKGAQNLGSLSDHLASIERQTGRRPVARQDEDEEEEVPFPEVLGHVWDWFPELAARRGAGMAGPNPLTHADVLAWATMTGRDPTPDEVRLLLRLDDTWLAVIREAREAK